MSSKLVVSADIFNLFETEQLTKLCNKRRYLSSSSENSSKPHKIKNKEDPEEIGAKLDTTNINFNLNNKLNVLRSEKSDITDKIESGDMNCSNKDNSSMDANKVNGEPPRETYVCVSASMAEKKNEITGSSLQTVVRDGPSQLETNNINNKNNIPVLLIKNSSGKSVPLLIKNPFLLKNSDSVEQKVFGTNNRTFIKLPNKLATNGFTLKSPNSNKIEISTPTSILTSNNKPETSLNSTETPKEKVEISTEKSTKISTNISTKISTETSNTQPKLKIDRRLVKSKNHPNFSTTSAVSTVQEFVVKTSSGKQVIIPNKAIPLKVVPNIEIPQKEAPKSTPENEKINTKNILINNQLVPVNFNTKFTVESATNTANSDSVLNIITNKKESPKKSSVDNNSKTKAKFVDTHGEVTKKFRKKLKGNNAAKNIKIPGNKLYQIQVEEETKNINKNDVDLLNGCVQMPMYVENWTQTTVEGKRLKDTGCQTDVYVAPTLVSEPIDDCPDIPELIEFLLSVPSYSTGMDETTKTEIINNSQKFKPPETAPIAPDSTKPKLSLKERLFFDLRDCVRLDFLGNMPIHNAVLDNNLNELKRQIYALRLRRFSVDCENNYDQTALHLAVINDKNEDIITTLLVNGASVFVKDNLGNTLLHLAVLNTNHHILNLILRYSNKDAKFLNVKNDEGLTALMVAAIECKPESVAVLLEFGADPNTRDDKSGRTALFHAVELNNIVDVNNTPVIDLLLQKKADPKVRNFFGLTALDAIKDPNTALATMMERNHPNAEPSASPKRRTCKRRTQGQADAVKNTKMAVVSKKLKVDLSTVDKQQELIGCSSELTKLIPNKNTSKQI